MSPRTITDRVRNDGPWTRLLPGVYLMHSGTPTRMQLAEAAVRYAGPRAQVTGLQGARMHGLRRLPDDPHVHLLVPDTAQPNSYGYVIVERTERLPRPVVRDGLPLAPVTRAVLDGVRRLTDPEQVQALLAESVQRGFTSPTRLMAELNTGSTRGTALPRRLLREVEAGVRSVSEGWAYRLVRRSGLPEPEWNVPIVAADGERLGIADAWWDDAAMAWEIDSLEFHLSPRAYARTVDRHNRLVAQGIVVVHSLPSDLRDHPQRVIAQLRATYRQALLRPRPPVRAILDAA